ncbi:POLYADENYLATE-BINDING PROTEIN INTERACTING PROTEIN [Salix viminalis]|uniref:POLYADENYLATE-BINDING PROTEIN INTERACTING PROTEIN n=1 Tax=Salix viminalis TaxID=40686 RepID=A0A9Q0Z7R6_SALVM|nr:POLYADENYLATE-BINDING PROTEIN INTERACTING PROTEIN [Salix viminalis]
MGYKNRAEAETEACLNEALLFATMRIIGRPVDVHIRDGSVYSGTFHTASFDKENGVVLKEARLTKKGKSGANLANGSVIETLIILSTDIVQVVAKGVLFPTDGITGNISGGNVEAAVTNAPSSEVVAIEAKKSNKFTVEKKIFNHNRSIVKNKNGNSHGLMPTKAGKGPEGRKMPPNQIGKTMAFDHGERDGVHIPKREASSGDSVNGRQTRDDGSQGEQGQYKQNFDFQTVKSADEVHSPNAIRPHDSEAKPLAEGQVAVKLLSNVVSCNPDSDLTKPDSQYCGRPASGGTTSPSSVCAGVSTPSNPMLDAPSEPHCSSSENSTGVVSPQISESNRSSKAFKLNPGAKKFSPSFSNPSSVNAATVPIVASMAYIPSNSPVVPVASVQPELGIPFAPRSSVPAKFPPYSNLTAVNGGNGSQFSQPVAGHMETRMQPLRHAGQYHAVQAASSYAPPNSQSVMLRRLGQVVYVQPVTHDLVPSPAAISTVSARPLLTPYQVQYPKHQGGAAGQTMQFCVAPSFVSGQQPFAVPSHIPFLQPPIPFQFQDLILSSAPSFHEHTPQ